MAIVIEFGESIDKCPDLRVLGMEDVRAVPMDFNAVDLFAVAIAGDVGASIDDEGSMSCLRDAARKDAAVHAGADNDVIQIRLHGNIHAVTFFDRRYQFTRPAARGGTYIRRSPPREVDSGDASETAADVLGLDK